MTRAMSKKRVTKAKAAPKVAVDTLAAEESMPPQQPSLTNDQYVIQVLSERCKKLETTLVQVAQELGQLKMKYEPEDPK